MSTKVEPVKPTIPSPIEMGVLFHGINEQIKPNLEQRGIGLTYELYTQDWDDGFLLLEAFAGFEKYSVRTWINVDYMSYRVQTDIMLVKGLNRNGGMTYQQLHTVYTGCYVNEPVGLAGRIAEQLNEAIEFIAGRMPVAVSEDDVADEDYAPNGGLIFEW